jgi:hypothetical protein
LFQNILCSFGVLVPYYGRGVKLAVD